MHKFNGALMLSMMMVGVLIPQSVSAQNISLTNKPMGNTTKSSFVQEKTYQMSHLKLNKQPRVDFIDISSWNGELSVEQFKQMKSQGVKGVVVKLTEGTTYRNPIAAKQIQHAQKAGLKVSAYHYSWFETDEEAIEQANYFADFAEELGLSHDSVMVNDAEESILIPIDPTKVSIAFRNQLEKRGFKNVIHYASASWFNNNWMEYDKLGKENSWVAEWPDNPSNNNSLHADTAAWQWTGSGEFSFLPDQKFDFNVDYLSRFTH